MKWTQVHSDTVYVVYDSVLWGWIVSVRPVRNLQISQVSDTLPLNWEVCI